MNSRYFLINGKGERRELCSLIEHPRNFYGFKKEIIKYKDDADAELNQQGIKFEPFDITLKYKGTDYQDFIDGSNFFDLNTDMLLEKQVISTGQSYLRRVTFKDGMLTPIRQVELYEVEIKMVALSMWFQDEVTEIITTNDTTSTYPMDYPFVYGNIGVGETILFNDFNVRVPLQIEFVGVADNPEWQLESPFGEVLYQGKINYTSLSTEKIVINSNRGTVELRNASDDTFIDNIFQYQDFSLETWTYMDFKGEYKFKIAHDGLGTLKCDVKYRKIRPLV